MKITCLNLLAFYIDPGSGALAWQALVCALFGFLFYIRRSLSRLIGLVRRNRTGVIRGQTTKSPKFKPKEDLIEFR